jgi:hypothetical protein
MFVKTANEKAGLYHHEPYLTIDGPHKKDIDDFSILAAWLLMALLAVVIWSVIYG